MHKISIPIIYEDPFLGDKEIKWIEISKIKTAAYPMQANVFSYDNKLQIYLSLEYWGGNSYLVLYFDKSRIKALKGDELILQFDNHKNINFFFENKPKIVINEIELPIISFDDMRMPSMDLFFENYSKYLKAVEKEKNNNKVHKEHIRSVGFRLESKQLKCLWNHKLTNWRLILNGEGSTCIDGVNENSWYHTKNSYKKFNYFVDEFINILIENNCKIDIDGILSDDENNTISTTKETDFEWCYVYLMVDKTNGYHKIGVSNNPHYRESTLQSEKPSIELLYSHKYPSRKIALAIESALHNAFRDKHIRGEWFALDAVDIRLLKETLKV